MKGDVQANQIHARKFLAFFIHVSKEKASSYQVPKPRTAFW